MAHMACFWNKHTEIILCSMTDSKALLPIFLDRGMGWSRSRPGNRSNTVRCWEWLNLPSPHTNSHHLLPAIPAYRLRTTQSSLVSEAPSKLDLSLTFHISSPYIDKLFCHLNAPSCENSATFSYGLVKRQAREI